MKVLMEINTWANRCGYFFNAYLTPKDPDDEAFYPGKYLSPNNGYNCRHPKCERIEDVEGVKGGIGCCHTWACPLGIEADEEECAAYGMDYEESEFIVVDIPDADYNDRRMWQRREEAGGGV